MWTINTLKDVVYNWESLNSDKAGRFLELMNRRFSPEVFEDHLNKRRRAINNAAEAKKLLDGAEQSFPETVDYRDVNGSFDNMRGFAVVFTAGGEGERLRFSLIDRGESPDALRDFTKATYPLKNFYEDYGALQINLAMISRISREFDTNIPVIVTTGPESSITYRVIPEILRKHENFGLPDVMIVPQDERLHFTTDEKIAVQLTGGDPCPVTQPDETGGPLMKLKAPGPGGLSPLQRLSSLGCEKLLIVQGTAIYEPKMLAYMAAAAIGHDCVGVGIPRKDFPPNDPFGTFVTVNKDKTSKTRIIEQDIRNDDTREIVNEKTDERLPFNTGLYAVDRRLLSDNDLPDYATPPKEVLPELPKSPKTGYAATDILPLAKSPLILTVEPNMYAVIKTADDLETMSETAARFGLLQFLLNRKDDKAR